MSDIQNRTGNIERGAKGTSTFISNSNIEGSDPSWIGSIKALSAALTKLSEVASTIKKAEDIHFNYYHEILGEGIEMVTLIDGVVREALKKSFLKRNPKRKKEVGWASYLIISYTQLLSYITDPKELPKFDLEKLFGANPEALKFAKNVWNEPLPPFSVFTAQYSKLEKYKPKAAPKVDDFVEANVVSPILFAAILGPDAELKNLKSYKNPLYYYKKVEAARSDIIEYKAEDNSKYFYIVSKKFDEKKVDGKELNTYFCLTPETDAPSSKVTLKPLAKADNQQWTWGTVADNDAQYMCIVNRRTGFAIDVNKRELPEGKNVSPLVMWTPDGYETQNWLVAPDGHIFCHAKNLDEDKPKYKFVMDIDGDGVVGGSVCLYKLLPKDNPNHVNQMWGIIPVCIVDN